MTDFSKKWDARSARDTRAGKRRPIIFNWRVLVFVGIVVLAISLLFAFIHQPIYADTDTDVSRCAGEPRIIFIACVVWDIFKQNEQIIEKLDWNNCITNNMNKLGDKLKLCGEMP